MDHEQQTVTFGAGCFWGVEYVFRRVPGVTSVEVGYAGGITPDPTYREVCSHTTGHAEVCRVTFDDELVTFDQLLEVFWAMHDPTQVNRQGPDVGDQYRSCIFTSDAGAAHCGRGITRSCAAHVPAADRDRDPIRPDLLPGRGLPPGVLREERPRALLPRGSGEGAARSSDSSPPSPAARTAAPDRPRMEQFYGIRLYASTYSPAALIVSTIEPRTFS